MLHKKDSCCRKQALSNIYLFGPPVDLFIAINFGLQISNLNYAYKCLFNLIELLRVFCEYVKSSGLKWKKWALLPVYFETFQNKRYPVKIDFIAFFCFNFIVLLDVKAECPVFVFILKFKNIYYSYSNTDDRWASK